MKSIDKDSAMLVDIQYIKPRKNEKDYLYIIWKDIDTGEKCLNIIEEPEIDIYFEKPEYRNHGYNLNYSFMDRVEKRTIKAKDITKTIVEDGGQRLKQWFSDMLTTKQFGRIREIYAYPYVYGADYALPVYYRYKWMQEYDNNRPKPITKGFLDIEVDIMEATGFPNPAHDPIDMITLIDAHANVSYTFTLIGKTCMENNTEQMPVDMARKELKRRDLYAKRLETERYYLDNKDELIAKIHERFDDSYPDMDFKVYFYNNELKMLVHLFQLINSLKLDFIGVWNIKFDIPYIMGRLQHFGINPADVMCHPDFPLKECYFKEDKINFAVKNKSDFFKVSSYTVFYDQMIVYAAIRKGQSELRSNKLTYIAQRELNDEKLDYSEVGDLKTLGYKDWLTYLLYNIKDVLLQKGIEERTSDVDTYYLTSYQNITPYEAEFKQTVKLRNVQYLFYLENGKVPGENVNGIYYNQEKSTTQSDDDDEDEGGVGFEGALVGNPLLIDHFGVELFGKPTNNIFRFSIDMDMSSFYPSTIAANNIDPSCLVFKVIMNADQFTVRGGTVPYNGITDLQLVAENNDTFTGDIAKEAFDNFQTGNPISTAHKWLNLPSVDQFVSTLIEEGVIENGS